MSEKFSVYNNATGGAPPAAPMKTEAPLLFKRDGFIPPAQSFLDAIKMETNQSKHNDILTKYYKMLLSSIFLRWKTEEGSAPRPIKRKEKVEKPVVERKKIDLQVGKKLDAASDKVLITIGKSLLPVVKPPYKLVLNGLDLFGKGLNKADALIDKAILKMLVEPAILLYEKVMPPLQKVVALINQALAMTLEMLEREGERIIEFVIAPLAEALETVQILAKKIYTPFRKAKNWMARKLPSIPKPSAILEPLDRVIVKPLKTFINTFIATPMAKVLQKMGTSVQKGSQFLSKKGSMAYLVATNFCRSVGARIGRLLEFLFGIVLRRLGRFLLWLFEQIKKLSVKAWKFIRTLPQYLSRAITKVYGVACKLTQWAVRRFQR